MTGQVQAVLALMAALGLHLGAFSLSGPDTGPDSGAAAQAAGEQGDSALSLQAADGALATLVATWAEPPKVAEAAPAAATTPLAEVAPDLPSPENDRPAPVPMPMPAPAPPVADAEPTVAADPPKADPPPVAKADKAPATRAESKPAAAAESRKAQKAIGSGNGTEAGESGKGATGGASKAGLASLKKTWGAAISSRIERRKAYPAGADGATGTVSLRLTVARSGALQAVEVLKSSGHAALDAAAVKAAKSAGRFPAAPRGLDEASYSFRLSLRFAL